MNITINLFWIVVVCAVVVLFYFLKECFFKDKDTIITTNIIDKFPLVSQVFAKKTAREQNIENNQEIHEINKILKEQDLRIKHLEEYMETMNAKIQEQLDIILKEFEHRG